ncbi:hypothetical protein A9Z06_17365 [Rhizobium sp. YK2]|nr:hypothetical protein A9Z06_17365 [Rhizobium sp. YK2]
MRSRVSASCECWRRREAGRKHGITLLLLLQSIGQMRETYGRGDAASKWFESASWISFAAVNDPETVDYISKRCGTTTVEIDQVSRSSQASGSSRTRSKQLAARPLIQPHAVLRMRADEQIVFTAGNAPLRPGRTSSALPVARRRSTPNRAAGAATTPATGTARRRFVMSTRRAPLVIPPREERDRMRGDRLRAPAVTGRTRVEPRPEDGSPLTYADEALVSSQ